MSEIHVLVVDDERLPIRWRFIWSVMVIKYIKHPMR